MKWCDVLAFNCQQFLWWQLSHCHSERYFSCSATQSKSQRRQENSIHKSLMHIMLHVNLSSGATQCSGAGFPSIHICRTYLIFLVGRLQFSLHRLFQIQISVKLSNPQLRRLCPLFTDSASPSTSCRRKVCRLQRRHETCKWAIYEGRMGSRWQATREIRTKMKEKIRKKERRGRSEWWLDVGWVVRNKRQLLLVRKAYELFMHHFLHNFIAP